MINPEIAEKTKETNRTPRRLSNACAKLGIEYIPHFFGAKHAAEALGVGQTTLKRFVEPYDYCTNPHYRSGPMVALYCPIDVAKAMTKSAVQKARNAYASRTQAQLDAGRKAVETRIANMIKSIEEFPLWIIRGKSVEEIESLALRTHGGNYLGEAGEFYFCNRVARNCIRHNLTNYECAWQLINRGETSDEAYRLLRERIDKLVDEAYPQFSESDGSGLLIQTSRGS